MLRSHTWGKDAFKDQDRPVGFGVTQNKVYQYGFRLHIATNLLETTPLPKKSIHNYLNC